jgi:hypothetical protein
VGEYLPLGHGAQLPVVSTAYFPAAHLRQASESDDATSGKAHGCTMYGTVATTFCFPPLKDTEMKYVPAGSGTIAKLTTLPLTPHRAWMGVLFM